MNTISSTTRSKVLAILVFACGLFSLTGCHAEKPSLHAKKGKASSVAKRSEKNDVENADQNPVPPIVVPAIPEVPRIPEPVIPPVPPPPKVGGFQVTMFRATNSGTKSTTSYSDGSQPAIRIDNIRSSKLHPTKEQAIADALVVARTELMKQLELLEPPILTRPSLVAMRSNYIKGDIREVFPTESEKLEIKARGLNSNVRWVELDIELTEDQVQNLRSADRVTDMFRVTALVFAFLAALYGFLRLDQWTKGYLTLWLGLAAGALVVVVAILLA